MNKQLFDNLVSFLRQSHSEFQEKTTEWTCRMKSREIPTAALVLGNFLKIYFVMYICLKLTQRSKKNILLTSSFRKVNRRDWSGRRKQDNTFFPFVCIIVQQVNTFPKGLSQAAGSDLLLVFFFPEALEIL